MERLIADAAKMTDVQKKLGITVDANSMSFGNIVNAISVMQESMGIAGATADEAEKTISGSIGMMKASWQNLMTGIADENADFDQLMNDFVNSVSVAGKNILPRVRVALEGAAKLVSKLAPVIAEELPKLMAEILPELASATADLVVALAGQIPSIASALVDASVKVVDEIGNAFAKKIPSLSWLFENLETVVASVAATMLVFKFTSSPVISVIVGIVSAIVTLWKTNDGFREAVIKIWESIKEFFSDAWDFIKDIFSTVGEFFSGIWQSIKDAFSSAGTWFSETFSAAKNFAVNAWSNAKEGFQNIWSGIKSAFSNTGSWFATTFSNAKTAAVNGWSNAKSLFGTIWDGIKNVFSNAVDIGSNIVKGIKEGISNAWKNLKEWFSGLFDNLIDIAKRILGIASPSKVFKKIGGFTAEGFGAGFEDEFSHVKDDMEDALNFDDASVGINASVRKVGAGAAGGAFGGTSIGNININIDGAKYSDEQSLASAIALEIQNMTDRRAAVYA